MHRMSWPIAVCAVAVALGTSAPVSGNGGGRPTDNSAGATETLPAEVLGVVWEWVSFVDPKQQLDIEKPEVYTLELSADGAAAMQIDCNRGMSQFTLAEDNRITFGPIGMTMMACADDQHSQRFTQLLERVATYFLMDGDFFLELPMDSGTLRFRRAEGD